MGVREDERRRCSPPTFPAALPVLPRPDGQSRWICRLAQAAIEEHVASAAAAASAPAGAEEMAPLFDVMGGGSHLLLCSQSYLVKIAPGPQRQAESSLDLVTGSATGAVPAVTTVALRRISRVTSADGQLHLLSSDGAALIFIDPQPFEGTSFSSFMTRLNTYLGLAGLEHESALEMRREKERERERETERARERARERERERGRAEQAGAEKGSAEKVSRVDGRGRDESVAPKT